MESHVENSKLRTKTIGVHRSIRSRNSPAESKNEKGQNPPWKQEYDPDVESKPGFNYHIHKSVALDQNFVKKQNMYAAQQLATNTDAWAARFGEVWADATKREHGTA